MNCNASKMKKRQKVNMGLNISGDTCLCGISIHGMIDSHCRVCPLVTMEARYRIACLPVRLSRRQS